MKMLGKQNHQKTIWVGVEGVLSKKKNKVAYWICSFSFFLVGVKEVFVYCMSVCEIAQHRVSHVDAQHVSSVWEENTYNQCSTFWF